MSMKIPTPEQLEQQLQEAEAEHDRVREANRELQENFCPISLVLQRRLVRTKLSSVSAGCSRSLYCGGKPL